MKIHLRGEMRASSRAHPLGTVGSAPVRKKTEGTGSILQGVAFPPTLLKGTIQRFVHAQLALQISIPVPSCTSTAVQRSRCVLGLTDQSDCLKPRDQHLNHDITGRLFKLMSRSKYEHMVIG